MSDPSPHSSRSVRRGEFSSAWQNCCNFFLIQSRITVTASPLISVKSQHNQSGLISYSVSSEKSLDPVTTSIPELVCSISSCVGQLHITVFIVELWLGTLQVLFVDVCCNVYRH